MKRQALPGSPFLRLMHFLVLLLPSALMGFMAVISQSKLLFLLSIPAGITGILLARRGTAWRPPLSGPVILLYLSVIIICGLLGHSSSHPGVGLSRGLLLLIAVSLIAGHDLFRTGAEPRRRAKKWCARLQGQDDWPRDITEVRHLPEVHALRDAAINEPGPIFDLFADPRAEVRAAAFASFMGRPAWRAREAAAVLQEARNTPEPDVRAMAVAALATVDDPDIVHGLAGFFTDPAENVRAAAVWACLSDGGQRWGLLRDTVRSIFLSDRFPDQALPGAAGALPVVAICDLSTWALEAEPLGSRSVRTLIDHYNHILQTQPDYDLITDLTNQVLDSNTATILRVELATLLRSLGLLTPELLDRMSNADQPSAVRLLAAEAMLEIDPYHPDGLDVLRGLGRQPNREMALAIAQILQFRLGYDMALTGEPIPPQSKQAGEVVKRVMAWAVSRGDPRRHVSPTPSPGFGSAPGLMPATPAPTDPPMLPLLEPASRKKPW